MVAEGESCPFAVSMSSFADRIIALYCRRHIEKLCVNFKGDVIDLLLFFCMKRVD